MDLILTKDDQARLVEAQRSLLSPLDHSTHEEWVLDFLESMKRLIGASQAGAHFPNGDFAAISADYSTDEMKSYESYAPDVWNDFSMGRRLKKHRVFVRDSLYGRQLSDYVRSEYYNECVVPFKALDSAGMSVSLTISPDLVSTVTPMVIRDSTTRPFGEREAALLELLYPAFEAGLRVYKRLGQRRADISRAIDSLGRPVRICSLSGDTLHQTPALSNVLESDPLSSDIEAAMKRIADTLQDKIESNGRSPSNAVRAEVRTDLDTYSVSGCLVRAGLFTNQPCSMLVVEASEAPVLDQSSLADRFGLTPREAEVALLLCRRRSNREIAAVLSISPNTARHHTEHVMSKLGVHSRKDVLDAAIASERR